MARQKKSAPEAEGSWLDTYADMVTLLLCFFVLLFSQSTIEETKWAKLLEAFAYFDKTEEMIPIVITPPEVVDPNTSGANGNPGDASDIDFSDLAELIQDAINESGVGDDVSVSTSSGMAFIRFNNNLLFGPDSSILSSEARSFLDKVGDAFLEFEDQIVMVRINGHTAKTNRTGGTTNDRILSSDRANAVLMYLEDVKGFEPTKLISMGYGCHYPITDNDTEEGRSQNRRVEILVLGSTEQGIADSYWQSIFSGEMSMTDYQEVYQALGSLSGPASGEDDFNDFTGLGGTTDAIDRIQLDEINSGQE